MLRHIASKRAWYPLALLTALLVCSPLEAKGKKQLLIVKNVNRSTGGTSMNVFITFTDGSTASKDIHERDAGKKTIAINGRNIRSIQVNELAAGAQSAELEQSDIEQWGAKRTGLDTINNLINSGVNNIVLEITSVTGYPPKVYSLVYEEGKKPKGDRF